MNKKLKIGIFVVVGIIMLISAYNIGYSLGVSGEKQSSSGDTCNFDNYIEKSSAYTIMNNLRTQIRYDQEQILIAYEDGNENALRTYVNRLDDDVSTYAGYIN